MKDVCVIKEIYHVDDAKSIMELRNDTAPPWKDMVLKYLQAGKIVALAPAIMTDIVSGERIPGTLAAMEDGEFCWRSDLIYYFEKYNLELDKEFVAKVLRLENGML